MVDPGKKRLVAEWEPALGAFVTWPAALPGALLRDLALDAHLWVLVTDAASEIDAAAWFASQGVSPDRVTFVHAPQGDDAVWVRDWGPHPVMDEHGQLWCVGPRYVYATPFTAHEPGAPLETADREPLAALEYEPVDQRAQPALARALGLPFEKLPHAFTGDSVLSDGHDLLISTEVLVAENRFDGATWDEVRHDASVATGMGEHVVLPDYENWGIQHADCLLKVLDEERLLVRVRAEGCGGTPVKAVTLLSRRADDAETTRTPMRETALNGEYTAHLPQARPRVRSSTRSRRPPRTAACSAGRARRRRGCGRR